MSDHLANLGWDSIPHTHRRIDFFVVGAQKGGTTALARFLGEHPQIQMSTRKEAHFFEKDSTDWTRPDYTLLHDLFDWSVRDVIRGEATAMYSYWPASMGRIWNYNPHSKLIMLLRHPTLRAFSHWRMEIGRGTDTLPFEEAILRPLPKPSIARSPTREERRFSYLSRGRYASQVKRMLDLFPDGLTHFLRTDALWSRPDETMASVLNFLRVTPREGRREYIVPKVRSAPSVLSVAVRAELDAYFADDIRETGKLTGLDLSDWLDPGYQEPMQLMI
ncbi:MAG: sulfotransferase domain-containing protein [Enhydrobacter sp.]|nr:sulfotransferase domain-containing protein [Enhydrobacter sp.]